MYDNLLGEFFGTMVLIVFGVGVNANLNLEKTYAKGGGWICTAWGWGLGVLLGVFVCKAFGAPEADINPSVTVAKTYLGIYTWNQFFATAAVQTVGGILGAIIVYFAFLGHWSQTPGDKVGIFATAPADKNWFHGFITEFICTFFLMFCVLAVFADKCGPLPPGFGPYCVGLIIVAIGISLGGASGYAMSMARDLGPRIAFAILPIPNKGSANWGYAWVPCIAPMCGATLAAVLLKALHLC